MKRYLLPSSAALALGLAACNTGSAPLSSDFDPMRPPGASVGSSKPSTSTFSAGQFVSAIMDQTAFYNDRPTGGAEADQLLTRGTSMKVISEYGNYLKVELDNGKVGFVPIVMVEDVSARAADASSTNPGEIQIYPPLPGVEGTLPTTPPGEQPPGTAIPTEAPIDPAAVPSVEPLPQTAPLPGSTPVPLPPNREELKAMEEKAASEAR